MKNVKCCICNAEIIGYGNNPYPVVNDENSVCCDLCNMMVVIPRRLEKLQNRGNNERV